MKITFIYDHKPNETWSTPLSLLNEFKERGWETDIISISNGDDSQLQLWIQQDTPTDIVLFMDWGRFDSKWLDKNLHQIKYQQKNIEYVVLMQIGCHIGQIPPFNFL